MNRRRYESFILHLNVKMSKELIALTFCILLFILSAINAYYIWFRDGARKHQQRLFKEYEENAPGSVSKFDKIVTHPFMYKAGSIILMIGFMVGIIAAINSFY